MGAVATVVLAPLIPFSPVVGGLIAGYLHGGDRGDGLRIGTISGIVALIPLVLFAALVGYVFLFVTNIVGFPGFLGNLAFSCSSDSSSSGSSTPSG